MATHDSGATEVMPSSRAQRHSRGLMARMPSIPKAPEAPALPKLPSIPRVGLVGRIVAALIAVAVIAGTVALWPAGSTTKVHGEFTRAVGLFPGSDVRILGIKVGKVISVKPEGDRVAVDFEFDSKYKVPADANAAIVASSLVSDRYVQLFPAYTDGPSLTSGSTIGIEQTAVPVELDRVSKSLDDLLVALGPSGANKDGALSRFLDTSAKNLNGNGQAIHDTTRDLSKALDALSGGKDDLFGTVKNLQSFTSMLATNDAQVRRLNTDLASVSSQLEGERGDLAAALKNLAIALNEVSSFVHDNRASIKTGVAQLADVTGTVAKDRDALAETLTNAPVALSNLQNAYNPASGTLDTRGNARFDDPALLLCSLITGPTGTGNSQLCNTLRQLLPLPALNPPELPSGPLSSVPGAGAGAAAPAGKDVPLVDIRGADPTLGGLLKENR